jgi:hypothetical protein
MVWLYDQHIVEFPRFEFFLQSLGSNVQDNDRIWEAFLKWSTLDVDSAVTCLSWGAFPIVKVRKEFDPGSHGSFKPSEPDIISVRRDKVSDYSNGKDETRVYQHGKFLEMLILHELVHWGRHAMSREDYEDDPDSGRRFAMEAYDNVAQPHL